MNKLFLDKIEASRKLAQVRIAVEKKKLDEQYFTPLRVSQIMANMFTQNTSKDIRSLDPCCGVGNLAAALLSRAKLNGENTKLTLIEKDASLAKIAMENFDTLANVQIFTDDFFEVPLQRNSVDRIIVNPPYSKIPSNSTLSKRCEKQLGYKESNLYSAFVSRCLQLLSDDGELVAIIPRSFCNGTTFKKFRNFILDNYYIHEIYLFESRKIFSDSSVLQETVIIKIAKSDSKSIKISHERINGTVDQKTIKSTRVYFKADLQKFIHIPLAKGDGKLLESMAKFNNNLLSLGLRASTGKVVDFRCNHLLISRRTIPCSRLLYQDDINSNNQISLTPKKNNKKRFIRHQPDARSILIPKKNYIIVRRISFKESKTRIVAAPLLAKEYDDDLIGIENHLNYIWGEHTYLSDAACIALYSYLSTPSIDSYIRRFSGHTQINATDLNSLPIPTLSELEDFGRDHQKVPLAKAKIAAEIYFFQNTEKPEPQLRNHLTNT